MYRITITSAHPIPQVVTGEPSKLGELRQIDGLIYNPSDVAVIDAASQTRVIVAPFSLTVEAQSVDWDAAKSCYRVVGTDGSKITINLNPQLTVSIQEVEEAAADEEPMEESRPARGKKRAAPQEDDAEDDGGEDTEDDAEDFTPPPRKGAKPAAKAAPGKKRAPIQDDDETGEDDGEADGADEDDDEDFTPPPRKGAKPPAKAAPGKKRAPIQDDDETGDDDTEDEEPPARKGKAVPPKKGAKALAVWPDDDE